MEWFTQVIVPVLVSLIPAGCVLIGTLAGVRAQIRTSEEKAERQRVKIEQDQIERDEARQKR